MPRVKVSMGDAFGAWPLKFVDGWTVNEGDDASTYPGLEIINRLWSRDSTRRGSR